MDIMTAASGLSPDSLSSATMDACSGGDVHMFVSEHAMIIIFGGSDRWRPLDPLPPSA